MRTSTNSNSSTGQVVLALLGLLVFASPVPLVPFYFTPPCPRLHFLYFLAILSSSDCLCFLLMYLPTHLRSSQYCNALHFDLFRLAFESHTAIPCCHLPLHQRDRSADTTERTNPSIPCPSARCRIAHTAVAWRGGVGGRIFHPF